MKQIYLKAYAKINLGLDVLRRRDDGYHDLKTIMQSVCLYDTILIKKVAKFPYKFVCDSNRLPSDDKNIVNKAAKLLIEKYDIKDGVFIGLTKKIPISAGLGGGSSDCAATLVGMRRLFQLPITNDELMQIGKSLGADVPFCIMRRTALAEGIGENLTRIKPTYPNNLYVVLVRPPVFVSTQAVFKKLNLTEQTNHPNIDLTQALLEEGNIVEAAKSLGNVLEDVTTEMHPIINELKEKLCEYGAVNAIMSGSGPTVFGLFMDKQAALKAVYNIKHDYSNIKEVFLTTML